MKLGVIIVIYNSADVIVECLEALQRSARPVDRIVLCNNASPDESIALVRDWAARAGVELSEQAEGEAAPLGPVTILQAGSNRGFAGGVNMGLRALRAEETDLYWLLNPDALVRPATAGAILDCAAAHPGFGLMGGRVIYVEPGDVIQTDGGVVNRWTGICSSVNQGLAPARTPPPHMRDVDYVSGAHLVASRAYVDRVGLMEEDYFLYYEEVDWAARRGDMEMLFCAQADILHHGGTSIGTGTVTRRPGPFATYFNTRNRIRFMRRFRPLSLPTAFTWSALRALRLLTRGERAQAHAALCGLFGLRPPAAVQEQIAPEARAMAFGRGRG